MCSHYSFAATRGFLFQPRFISFRYNSAEWVSIMEKFIPGIQTAHCPKDDEIKDVYLVLWEATTIGDIKHYGFKENHCPEQHD